MATPSLSEFLDAAREDNPGVPEGELRSYWNQTYGHLSPAQLPSWETFLPAAKADNPNSSETDLRAYWEQSYGSMGAREREPAGGNVLRGGAQAFRQLPEFAYGLEAGAGAVGETVFGEGGVSTAIKEHGLKGLQEAQANVADHAKATDSLNYSWEQAKQGNPGALVDWLQYAIGYGGAQAAQMLATAGVGTIAGKFLLKPAVKILASRLIAKETARLTGSAAVKGMAAEEITKLATANVAAKIGQTTALAVTATGMEGGEIMGGLAQQATEEGRTLTGAEVGRGLFSSLAAGTLEFVGDKIGLDILMGRTGLSRLPGRLGRATAGAVADAIAEGATEFSQTLIEEYGQGRDPFSDEAIREGIDAAGMGAVGGGLVGGVGGTISSHVPPVTGVVEPPKLTGAAPPAPEDKEQPAPPPQAIPELIGVWQPGVGVDEAIKRAFDLSTAPSAEAKAAAQRLIAQAAPATPAIESRFQTPEQFTQALKTAPPVTGWPPGTLWQGVTQPLAGVPISEEARRRTQELVPQLAREAGVLPTQREVAPEKRPAYGRPEETIPPTEPVRVQGVTQPIAGVPLSEEAKRAGQALAARIAIEGGERLPTQAEVAPSKRSPYIEPPAATTRDVSTAIEDERRRIALEKERLELQRPPKAAPLPEPTANRDAQTTEVVTRPRHELPDTQNTELLLRAEKAQADLESADVSGPATSLLDFLRTKGGVQDQGGELSHLGVDTDRKPFVKKLIQAGGLTLDDAAELAHEAGYLPTRDIGALLSQIENELRGKGTAAPDWYRTLTQGPRPLRRDQIEAAVRKIIQDEGVDTGAAVERVKTAILGDQEFSQTDWGRDFADIVEGNWPSWIERPSSRIDTQAQVAATSEQNALPQPTEGQKAAGNYQKGHLRIAGLDISIENPEGSTRSGTDASGKPWSVTMKSHYGYIRGTKGKDKDHLDVFVKPGTPEDFRGTVYIVDQNKPGTKVFDEHKIILGAESLEEAKRLYLENYAKDWQGLGAISAVPMAEFQQWLLSEETGKPYHRQERLRVEREKLEAQRPTESAGDEGAAPLPEPVTPPSEATEEEEEDRDVERARLSNNIARAVRAKLEQAPLDQSIALPWLTRLADDNFGGTQASGAYTPKDLFDAVELGVNQYILHDLRKHLPDQPTNTLIKARVSYKAIVDRILNRLPTQQNRRTAEQDEFQQFSTPPQLAFVMTYAAHITPDDTVLEPSAGIGGLAAFAKMMGATVVVNEYSARRAALLRELNPGTVYHENAEQLHNILPATVKPTVIVMNPPFSSTAGRMEGQRSSANVLLHLNQALKRLEPNGRLVALIGKGKEALGGQTARVVEEWIKLTAQKYAFRARIGLSGADYKKYGTTYDNQILIFDKMAPDGQALVQATLDTPFEALTLLEGVRDARIQPAVTKPATGRTEQPAPREPRSETLAQPGEGGVRPQQPVSPTAPTVGARTETAPAQTARPTSPGTRGVSTPPSPTGEGAVIPPSGKGQRAPGEQPLGRPSAIPTEPPGRGVAGRPSAPASPGGASRPVSTESPDTLSLQRVDQDAPIQKAELSDDGIYETYRPQKIRVEGAKDHPGELVQSAAMGAVEAPDATYAPQIEKGLLERGSVSIAQLEPIVYAGQSHAKTLPNGMRRGFFIGDGTGVGKGREISGIILDNFNQGRTKAVWISKKPGLIMDAKRDWSGIEQDPNDIFDLKGISASDPITRPKGILFTSYTQLIQGLKSDRGGQLSKAKKKGTNDEKASRLDQLVAWIGADFDGVIAFDEAHAMANAAPASGGKMGGKDASTTGLVGLELQKRVPNARIVYVSATGATEVSNLAYAERLGLWGEGTAFPNRTSFMGRMIEGGLAAMEVVAQNMKALGLYVARQLSFRGVTYDRLEHALSPAQRDIYNEMARGWQLVYQNIQSALEETGGKKNALARGAAKGKFMGAQQRFFNQILTSMQMPSVIDSIKRQLDEGHAVVLQLVNTNESGLGREIEKATEEGSDLESVDLTPRETLLTYVEKAFPTQQFEEYLDENGKKKTRPVYDSQGRPVQNAEAVRMKEELLNRLGSLRVPDGALEILLDTFGEKQVAEVTGRTERLIRVTNEEGRVTRVHQKSRTPKVHQADAKAFMDDKKRILVFSDAGGTGMSYHAERRAKNQRKRIHYLVQPGWRADNAVQGFGRTHRSNQVQPPHYILVTTDLKGHKRFISSVARRLDQLGALTKGQRQTGTQGFFQEEDNIEGHYANVAIKSLMRDLFMGQVPGQNWQSLAVEKMAFDNLVDPRDGKLIEEKLPEVSQFLNRILALEYEEQNATFDLFAQRMRRAIDKAKQNGEFDTGLENYKADGVTLTDEQVVYTHPDTGATAKLLTFDTRHKVDFVPFEDAKGLPKSVGFYTSQKTGKVFVAIKPGTTHTTESGEVREDIILRSPIHGAHSYITTQTLERSYEKLTIEEARTRWNATIDKTEPYRTESVHLLSGILLPIWDRLPSGFMRVLRVTTDDGRRYIGRRIQPDALHDTKRKLNIEAAGTARTPQEAIAALERGGTKVTLANGWTIAPVTVAGETRYELSGDDLYQAKEELAKAGVFSERISFTTRWFIPVDQISEALTRLTRYRPISDIASTRGGTTGVAEEAAPYRPGFERALDNESDLAQLREMDDAALERELDQREAREEADRFSDEASDAAIRARHVYMDRMESRLVSPGDIEDAVRRATRQHAGAAQRWNAARETGLTDEQLRDAIAREFGIEGGQGAPRTRYIHFKGGKNPTLWIGHPGDAKLVLKGKRLLAAVRDTLQIPKSVERPGQQTIAIPPPVIGSRPIIGREPTAEEAPLFSKGYTEPEPEQGTLFEPTAPYRAEPVPAFFSQAARVITQKMPNRASMEQVKGILSPQNGVKAEELKWIGLDDYLKSKDYFTKDEVLTFIQQHQVQVEEVEKGKPDPKRMAAVNKAYNEFVDIADDHFGIQSQFVADKILVQGSSSLEIISQMSREMKIGRAPESVYEAGRHLFNAVTQSNINARTGGGEPKFSQYQLPGGTDYRELLLTLPAKRILRNRGDLPEGWTIERNYNFGDREAWTVRDEKGVARWGAPGTKEEIIEKAIAADKRNEDVFAGNFRSSHWSEPNVLAHVRFNTREVDGKKVLFLEEIQSDWHQKGRRSGYKQPVPQLTIHEEELSWVARDAQGLQWGEVGKGTVSGRQEAEEYLNRYIRQREAESTQGVPNAPFKTTWHELALKRMLRYAAEHGYDALAWTTGEQQAERYDLSKQVKAINWYDPRYDGYRETVGTREVAIEIPRGSDITIAIDDDGKVLTGTHSQFYGQHLSDVVGKDIADKILAAPNGTLSGEGLRIGGEGMKGFYNKILPAFLNKYGKKWGAQVEAMKAPVTQSLRVEQNKDSEDGEWRLYDPITGDFFIDPVTLNVMSFDTKHAAQDWLAKKGKLGGVPVHAFPITESMKHSVLTDGQALFENNPKYALREGESRAVNDDLAKDALGDLDRAGDALSSVRGALRPGERPGVKTLALGISPDLVHQGVVDLTGRTVASDLDLAQLAQVYRNPLFETFRIFYLKGTEIVGHEGITSRMPGFVRLFHDDTHRQRRTIEIQEHMDALGANGYWLLHNHPSGRSLPSPNDMNTTAYFAKSIPGFKGHVVIDSNEYAEINFDEYDDLVHTVKQFEFGPDQLLEPSIDHPLLNRVINSPGDVLSLGQRLKAPDQFATVFYWASNGRVRAIQEVSLEFLTSDEAPTYLAEQGRAFGAHRIFTHAMLTRASQPYAYPLDQAARRMIEAGILQDHVTEYASTGRGVSMSQSGIVPPSGEMILGKRVSDLRAESVREAPAPYTVQQAHRELSYALPPMSAMDDVIRLIQDKNIDTVRLVDAIKEAGGKVTDTINPVLREEMYMGRTSQRLQDFLTDELRPLVDAMRVSNVSLADLDRYLHARHAEEANLRLQEINQDLAANEALSGMSTEDAKKILREAPPALARLATRVDGMIAKTRDLMVSYGLESTERVESWKALYQHYVPLKREGFEETTPGTGMGRSIRGSTVKARLGSHRGVIDILANIALQREQTIVRGEKMRPTIALAGLLTTYPNPNIGQVVTPTLTTFADPETGLSMSAISSIGPYQIPQIRFLNPRTGQVEFRPDPGYKSRDNVVNFRIDGKDHAILLNEENPRAMAIAHAMRDLDVGQLNTVMSGVGRVTRYLASINTQYNPVFGVVNFIRDVQFAMVALANTPLADKRSEIWASTWQAIRGIYTDARAVRRGEHPTSSTARLWERFQHVGGPTGYRDLFRTSQDRAKAIERLLDPDWWQRTRAGKIITAGGWLAGAESAALRQVGQPIVEWLSDYNQTMENAVRLGVFKAGLDAGLSDEQAASYAKNITVNFNKKGQISAQMGSMYAFFNASVQGTARLAQTLFEKGKFGTLSSVGKRIAAGGVTLGAIQAFALAMAGFDEDEPPEWLRQRALILPVPGTDKGYVSVPMPLGFNILPTIGRLGAELLMYGKPMERGAAMFSALLDIFSPVGGGGSLPQTLAPTVADPFVALSENRDWTGRAIAREDFSPLHPTPGFSRTRATSTPWARGLAEVINYATGGTEYQPGLASPTPDQIDYLITQATGGIGRELAHTGQLLQTITSGEETPLYKMPLAGRLMGSASGLAATADEFYRNLRRINLHEAEIKGRRQHGQDASGYLREHPDARLAGIADRLEREMQALQRRKREYVQRGKREQVRLMEQQIQRKMERLNQQVRALQAAS